MAFITQQESGLGEAIAHGGDVLGRVLGQIGQNRREREKQTQLASILGQMGNEGRDEITDEQILQISTLQPQLANLLQQQKIGAQKQAATQFKETAKDRAELLEAAKGARENEMRLARMEALSKSGKLVTPLYNDLLKRFGIDWEVLKNPESEEFQKLSNDMLKNIRQIFGNRVTNLDVESFLKTIPTLSNTPEGRERIIKNLRQFNETAIERAQVMQDIISENRGIPPLDLKERVEERIGPKLDQITESFTEEIPASSKRTFERLPSALDYEGQIIRDDKTGKRFKSENGKWKIIK